MLLLVAAVAATAAALNSALRTAQVFRHMRKHGPTMLVSSVRYVEQIKLNTVMKPLKVRLYSNLDDLIRDYVTVIIMTISHFLCHGFM